MSYGRRGRGRAGRQAEPQRRVWREPCPRTVSPATRCGRSSPAAGATAHSWSHPGDCCGRLRPSPEPPGVQAPPGRPVACGAQGGAGTQRPETTPVLSPPTPPSLFSPESPPLVRGTPISGSAAREFQAKENYITKRNNSTCSHGRRRTRARARTHVRTHARSRTKHHQLRTPGAVFSSHAGLCRDQAAPEGSRRAPVLPSGRSLPSGTARDLPSPRFAQ